MREEKTPTTQRQPLYLRPSSESVDWYHGIHLDGQQCGIAESVSWVSFLHA